MTGPICDNLTRCLVPSFDGASLSHDSKDRALEAALHWIEDRRAGRDRQPQLLLALLCEQLHERLQQDGTPPRTSST
jgi:hypothetical protein